MSYNTNVDGYLLTAELGSHEAVVESDEHMEALLMN